MKSLSRLQADQKYIETMLSYWLKIRQTARTIPDSEFASEQAKRFMSEWDEVARQITLALDSEKEGAI
jgi:hypothetical protein